MENIIIKSKLTYKEYFKLILIIRLKSTKCLWDLLWITLIIVILTHGNFSRESLNFQSIFSNGYFKILLLLLYPISIYLSYKKKFYSKENLLNENLIVEFHNDKIIYNSKVITSEIEYHEIYRIENINQYLILHFGEKYLILNCRLQSKFEVEKIVEKIKSSKTKKPNG